IASSKDSIELASKYEGIYATAGIHPHDALGLEDGTLLELAVLCRQPKVVAIGEIGLDFYRNLSPRDVQLNALRRQLDLASELGLPVIIHDRDAHNEILGTLGQWVASGSNNSKRFRGVIHCFSGDRAFAEECISLGFMISFAANITYPGAATLTEVARTLPLEYLLVETDCPFLAPHSRRSNRNEPANVGLVAKKIAELRGIAFEEIARVTTSNAVTLFDLALPTEGPARPA
ncbi:MAG: TatD family hydrolase, partial [Dehalococcoidia bacterium]|nr:TatD family hydrolase [Dehalococcoidia bacterium]